MENIKKKEISTHFSMGNKKIQFGKTKVNSKADYFKYRLEGNSDKYFMD